MGAYLIDHKPRVSQFSNRVLSRITGCTVLHSTESVFDEIGTDTGAEGVARYISTRTTYGSYHSLVDSDSRLVVVPFHLAAYQDGTGSNPWAMSVAFACRTTDWARMTPAYRRRMLRQGALAFKEQQAWKAKHGLPRTELRLITKAQSDAGWSGFIYHGHRDPGRRSDPGTDGLFPWGEWIEACRWAMAGGTGSNNNEEDDVALTEKQARALDALDDFLYPRVKSEPRAMAVLLELRDQARKQTTFLHGLDLDPEVTVELTAEQAAELGAQIVEKFGDAQAKRIVDAIGARLLPGDPPSR